VQAFNPNELPENIKKKNPHLVAVQSSQRKPMGHYAPERPPFCEEMAALIRIRVHSIRGREFDCDNVRAKAVIDGIQDSGLLSTDSIKCVKEVIRSGEVCKDKAPQTIITVEEYGFL